MAEESNVERVVRLLKKAEADPTAENKMKFQIAVGQLSRREQAEVGAVRLLMFSRNFSKRRM